MPQGSPLSPVLANMFLDPLDEVLLSNQFKMVRYADDFVVLCKTLESATQALNLTNEFLDSNRLSLNPDKTRVTDFESGFVFLGHFFIGNLVQSLATAGQKLTETSWRWDNAQNIETKTKHAFSGQIVEERESQVFKGTEELQREILDCSNLDSISESNNEKLNLNNKLRTLYLSKQGCVLHKIAGKFEVRYSGETIQQIPITQLDSIMCFGAIHLTRAVMIECLENSLPIILMTQSGHWIGIIKPNALINKQLLLAQIKAHDNPLKIAKALIHSKLQNSIVVLRRRLRFMSEEIQQSRSKLLEHLVKTRRKIEYCSSIDKLRGLEGYAAKIYFELLRSLIHPQWNFKTRNRRPPCDPVNALLSLGYTILFNNIYAFVMLRQLSMEFGFIHSHYNNQPALALDLMEPFRAPVVDALVLKLISNNLLKTSDFEYKDKACLLTPKAKNIFVSAMEEKMSQKLVYEALGLKTDYRRIMDLQVSLLKQSLLSDAVLFKPFGVK